MNALAEHLLDPTLRVLADQNSPEYPLHIQHEPRAVTVAAAVYYLDAGAPVVIVNGMFRPAQFAELEAAVADFNRNPARGWSQLAADISRALTAQATELNSEAARLMSKSIDWI